MNKRLFFPRTVSDFRKYAGFTPSAEYQNSVKSQGQKLAYKKCKKANDLYKKKKIKGQHTLSCLLVIFESFSFFEIIKITWKFVPLRTSTPSHLSQLFTRKNRTIYVEICSPGALIVVVKIGGFFVFIRIVIVQLKKAVFLQ